MDASTLQSDPPCETLHSPPQRSPSDAWCSSRAPRRTRHRAADGRGGRRQHGRRREPGLHEALQRRVRVGPRAAQRLRRHELQRVSLVPASSRNLQRPAGLRPRFVRARVPRVRRRTAGLRDPRHHQSGELRRVRPVLQRQGVRRGPVSALTVSDDHSAQGVPLGAGAGITAVPVLWNDAWKQPYW